MKLLLLSAPDMHIGRFYTCVCLGVGVEAQGQIWGLKSRGELWGCKELLLSYLVCA